MGIEKGWEFRIWDLGLGISDLNNAMNHELSTMNFMNRESSNVNNKDMNNE